MVVHKEFDIQKHDFLMCPTSNMLKYYIFMPNKSVLMNMVNQIIITQKVLVKN